MEGLTGAAAGRRRGDGPVAIEVRGVEKAFRIPEQRIDSLKERVAHPLRRLDHRVLHALRGVSFDVRAGEFFGIVGRNGSGKSTLLKIMASIYRADGGRIRTAGRVAPFIELGVGFNPELTARENCVLNGVLMGLSRREARRRLDAVLEFAELEEFVDLRLKNYSSGMMVRFAFAIMVQAEADIMLIDEVLAVGDAAFGRKCMDVFHERRRAGRTVVLVTHDMSTVQALCHRALLLHDGAVEHLGEPEETALRYLRRNFDGAPAAAGERPVTLDVCGRIVSAGLHDGAGAAVEEVAPAAPLALDVRVEALRDLERPIFVVHVVNAAGVVVLAFTRTLDEHVAAGGRIRLAGRIENRLVPGRYSVDCWIREDRDGGAMALQALRLFEFTVAGTAPRHGVVTLDADVEPVLETPART